MTRPETLCYLCDSDDIQGTRTHGPICVKCDVEPRECDACGEVARIGLSCKTVELCFPCWQEALYAGRWRGRETQEETVESRCRKLGLRLIQGGKA